MDTKWERGGRDKNDNGFLTSVKILHAKLAIPLKGDKTAQDSTRQLTALTSSILTFSIGLIIVYINSDAIIATDIVGNTNGVDKSF